MTKFIFKNFCIFFLLACCATSCGPRYTSLSDRCVQPIPQRILTTPVRVALVLGGGGARGLAHVGVLEELEKVGIPIDVIVGCSAGAIVGALYADCIDIERIKCLLQPLKRGDILDINIWNSRYGLVQGHSLRSLLHKNMKGKTFEDLQIPLYVVATDIVEGELVTFSSGPIIPAVHASAAVPLLFAPVVMGGRLLVDGGVLDPTPVEIAKRLKAEVIIAVDLCELLPKTCPNHLFGVAARSAELKFLALSNRCVQGADVVIKPDLDNIGMFEDRHNNIIYEAGKKAARDAIPLIQAALAQHSLLDEECYDIIDQVVESAQVLAN